MKQFENVLKKVYDGLSWATASFLFIVILIDFVVYCLTCNSVAVEYFLFFSSIFVFNIVIIIDNHRKLKKHLLSLPTSEQELLYYVYKYSQDKANAVYIPCNNAAVRSLQYKKILRKYDYPSKKCANVKCFLYGIRKNPNALINGGKEKVFGKLIQLKGNLNLAIYQ